jgi:hypothetical protein
MSRESSDRMILVLVALALVSAFTLSSLVISSQAYASPSVSTSVSGKTVSLGSAKRIQVNAKGIPTDELDGYSYAVEVAAFPYTRWVVEATRPLAKTRFSVLARPRTNSKYRVVLKVSGTSVTASKPILLYVQGKAISRITHGGPGTSTIQSLATFDSSIVSRFNAIPARQRKVYVYIARGDAEKSSRPVTKYKLYKTLPLRMTVKGNIATLRVKRTFRRITSAPYPTYWIWFSYAFRLRGTLPNGDEGIGKPKPKRLNTMISLLGKKSLSYSQIKKMST